MKLLGDMYATLEQVRMVWAGVSKEPRITITELSQQTGIHRTKVNAILKFLEAAGYIEHRRNCAGRRVLLPLVECPVVYAVTLPIRAEGIAPRSNLSQKPSRTIP